MEFDLSDVTEALGESEDWGIYANGVPWDEIFFDDQAIKLFEGTPSEGILLGRTVEETITGKSAKFETGNKFKFSFPDFTPEDGKLYTVEITLLFNAVKKGESKTAGSKYKLSYVNAPLDLTFIGSSTTDNKLTFKSSNIKDGESQKTIEHITLEFNQPTRIVNNNAVTIVENGTVTYSSDNIMVNDNMVDIKFEDVLLLDSHNYSIVIPENMFSNLEESSNNRRIVINVIGSGHYTLPIISISPENDRTNIVSSLDIKFGLPDGSIFTEPSTYFKYPAELYQLDENEELNLISTLYGIPGVTEDNLKFSVDVELLPSTRYVILIKDGTFNPRKYSPTTNRYTTLKEYANDEIIYNFQTPSIDNCNLDPMKFLSPALDAKRTNLLNSDIPMENIENLYFQLKDCFYTYQGENYKLKILNNEIDPSDDSGQAILYKITETGETIIKNIPLGYSNLNTSDYESYRAIVAKLNSTLYNGVRYRLVIPAGVLTVESPALTNFLYNEEISVEFIGKSESKLNLSFNSFKEGDSLSCLSSAILHCDKEVVRVQGVPGLRICDNKGEIIAQSGYVINYHDYSNVLGAKHKTVSEIYCDFTDKNTFEPKLLPTNRKEYQLIIAAGSFADAYNSEITNDEIIINFKRTSEVSTPEYVTLTSTINDHASTIMPIERGLKGKVTLTPSDDWKIDQVLFNGEDVTSDVDETGNYETPAINEDSFIEAHLAYNGDIYFEDSTGVTELPDSNIRVLSDETFIRVTGLAIGDNIKVYTPAGILVAEHVAADDISDIYLSQGHVYIIVISETNGRKAAVKINH